LNGKLLDIGAGEADRYGKYLLVTSTIRMDLAKNDNVDIVGSADAIPFPDESFDSVLCTQVFEHLKYPQRSAKEIYRILKKGGSALVTVPQTNELHEEPNDFFRYTKYGIASIFEDAGFKVVHSDQRGGYYSNLAQIRIRRMIDVMRLYDRPFIGRVVGKAIGMYGRFMVWLDIKDQGKSNRKHAIGWCFVFKK